MSQETYDCRCYECGAMLQHPRQLHSLADCNHFRATGEVRFYGLASLPSSSHGNCKDRQQGKAKQR